MKGVEVDFDAIEIGESRSDVKAKKPNSRVNLGDVPNHAKAEYIPTSREGEDGEPEDFIKLDVGEGQDFETLNYNHRLRRKLRRAIDNAEIRKEMLVRQRACDYYNEKNIEVPPELNTPYKPINVKGQRILENGTFETAKQERVRSRMELAEFNSQMRILRKQAKDAAIYAGLHKHAELTGKIESSDVSIKQGRTDNAEQYHDPTGIIAPEDAFSIGVPGAAGVLIEQSRAESVNSTSSESSDEPENDSSAPSMLEDDSYTESSTSNHSGRDSKRQLLQNDGSRLRKQKDTTHSDRQAMIDAELALGAKQWA